jgi:tRNA(Ile)-lysidine synthase
MLSLITNARALPIFRCARYDAVMPTPRGLIQELDQHLHRSEILRPRAKLAVAVSGGADSVALLRLLHAINRSKHWRWKLFVAHVDHGIRGRSSAADARFVKELAGTLSLPYIGKKLRLGRAASEATARAARFAALQAIVEEKKCDAVVLAHHADDQAETVLLRLIRGAGLDGLSAMVPATRLEDVVVVRPLLHVRRAALRDYLTSIDQPWREDETNATDAYLRNRIRSEVMPILESLAPSAVDVISRTAQLAGEAQGLIEALAWDLLDEAAISRSPGRITMNRSVLQVAAPIVCGETFRQIVLQMGGSTESTDFERTRAAVRAVQGQAGGKTIQLGRGLLLRAGTGVVTVEKSR